MPAPAAPLRASVPLPTPAAPATTYKTYSSYSPSPSEISYRRTFYSKVRKWTGDVRPQSTILRGRSAVWSDADVREEAPEDVQRKREDSPTPSNPYPRVRSSGGRAVNPVHHEEAVLVHNRSNGRRLPDTSLAAVNPSPAVPLPKYRSNPTPHPSRPNSHESSQSSLPSRRHLRDAYLAEALATPDLEVMSPVMQRKQGLGKGVLSLPVASKAVELEQSRSLRVLPDIVQPGRQESQTGGNSAALLSPPAGSRIKSTAVHLTADVNSPGPVRFTPPSGRSVKQSARSLMPPKAHNIPLSLPTVTPAGNPSTIQPSRGPVPPSTVELATRRALPPSTAHKPNSASLSRAAAVHLPPSTSSLEPSRLLPVSADRGGEPRPAASRPVVPNHPSSLRPVLKTHPSTSSLYPGSALGRPLGMKHRDTSTGALQARFEPAVYPLPLSASTVTTGLPVEREVGSNKHDPEAIGIQPQPVHARSLAKQASTRHTSDEQRSEHPPEKPLPAPYRSSPENHYSFEVPQGDHHRLHVSLAWHKNDSTPSRTRALSDDGAEGPPVPSKSPPAGQSFLNNSQWPQPYSHIYPQPMYYDPYYRHRPRPLSPPAPFFPPLRRHVPYPESEGSIMSEPPLALRPDAFAFANGFIPPQVKDAGRDHVTEDGHWAKSVVREGIAQHTQGYRRNEIATAASAPGERGQPLWNQLKASLTRPFARTGGLLYAPSRDLRQQSQDQVDWSRSRLDAARVDRLEAREREGRIRAERDEYRRRERRARRAEDKARRADERRARRKEREERIAFESYRMSPRRLTERFQQTDKVSSSRRAKTSRIEKQKIARIPWRERLQSSRKPASYYKPRATPLQAMNSAPTHHYDTEAAENHMNRWRQAQSKLATRRRTNNGRGKVTSRFAWLTNLAKI